MAAILKRLGKALRLGMRPTLYLPVSGWARVANQMALHSSPNALQETGETGASSPRSKSRLVRSPNRMLSEHDDLCTDIDPVIEIRHVTVCHPNATGGNRSPDGVGF